MERILVVDDENDLVSLVSDILESAGYKVVTASKKDAALTALKRTVVDLALLDVCLSQGTQEGLELLEYCSENLPDMPVIMMSGHSTLDDAVQAMRAGAVDFIEKPFSKQNLLKSIQREIGYAEMKKTYKRLKKFDYDSQLIAESKSMQDVLEQVEKIADNNTRVMLLSESGAGASTIAYHIHSSSNKRKEHRYFELNCRDVADKADLLRRLVGVNNANNGLLFASLDGTLVLDKIHLANSEVQTALQDLLSQLNNNNINLKIVSIAEPVIEEMLANGEFRKDLYTRLSTVTIQIPPLRERIDDILPLVKKFALPEKPEVPDDIMKVLYGHEWTGNLHELKNTVTRMLILNPHTLDIQALSWNVCSLEDPEWINQSFKEAVEAFERRYIEVQMRRTSGNQTIAAQLADIDRSTLYRKLRAGKKKKTDDNEAEDRKIFG